MPEEFKEMAFRTGRDEEGKSKRKKRTETKEGKIRNKENKKKNILHVKICKLN